MVEALIEYRGGLLGAALVGAGGTRCASLALLPEETLEAADPTLLP